MEYLSRQKIIIFIITVAIFFIVPTPVLAAGKYIPLEYLPGAGQPNQPVDLQTYSSALLRIGIILAAILAVITITIGGIRYITAGSSLNSTEEARNMIKQALIGLLVVLFSYLLLYTVNPDILKNGLNLKTIQTTPSTPNSTGALNQQDVDRILPQLENLPKPTGGAPTKEDIDRILPQLDNLP